jgi:23S rRNA pseudouridine1911/1915/1917 synthase
LHYKVIRTLDNYYLLEIDLETGRHHQIRAQLAKVGIPIKGDLKYGAPSLIPMVEFIYMPESLVLSSGNKRSD